MPRRRPRASRFRCAEAKGSPRGDANAAGGGRCRTTWCSRPTSESTWNGMAVLLRDGRSGTPGGDGRRGGHRGPVLEVDRDAGQEGDAGEDERQVLPDEAVLAGVA